MSTADLVQVGPWDVWQGAARHGRLDVDGQSVPVLLLLGPEDAAPDALWRARVAAAPVIGVRRDGLLTLLAVENTRSEHQDDPPRVGWAYEQVDGIGVGHAVSGPRALPARAAAEVVARVAEILLSVPADWRHRGPEPSDLLVDSSARIFVSGFVGPFPTSPHMRAPQGDEGEAATVYRLGVLLAQLVSGAPPVVASERAAHAASVRRVLIRAMARPGPILADRYADWIQAMLAWQARERPPLSAVPDGLRNVASQMHGENLAIWASTQLPLLEQEILRAHIAADEEVSDPQSPALLQAESFEAGTITDARDDDPTQEESQNTGQAPEPSAPAQTPPGNPGLMPIRVGPPPEALREMPRLPTGFLDETDPGQASDEQEPAEMPGAVRAMLWAVWGSAVLLLLGTAVLLVLYLLLPPSGPDHDPGLSDALSGPAPREP